MRNWEIGTGTNGAVSKYLFTTVYLVHTRTKKETENEAAE